MIAVAAVGVGLIFVLAGVVGVIDRVRAANWRWVAAERRQSWEARQQPTAGDPYRAVLPTAGR